MPGSQTTLRGRAVAPARGGKQLHGSSEATAAQVLGVVGSRALPLIRTFAHSLGFQLAMVVAVPGLLALVSGWLVFGSRVTGGASVHPDPGDDACAVAPSAEATRQEIRSRVSISPIAKAAGLRTTRP